MKRLNTSKANNTNTKLVYAMTKSDKDEIKGMVDNLQQFIDLKLEHIIEQTTKTNGTVQKHEQRLINLERELPHSITGCPQNGKIEELWNDRLTNRKLLTLSAGVATIAGILVGIVYSIISLIDK